MHSLEYIELFAIQTDTSFTGTIRIRRRLQNQMCMPSSSTVFVNPTVGSLAITANDENYALAA
jgi:hypothetical protein